MASVTLISVSGGGLKPPTTLTATLGTWVGGTAARTVLPQLGCIQSASITSATLTEVVNESVGGVLTFAAIYAAAAATTDSKFRIVRDGITVLDDSGTAITDADAALQVVGSVAAPSGSNLGFSEGQIIWNSTLVISIAGDGTNGAQLSHKLYLTG